MSRTLAVEFSKTRRRRIWLPVLAILAVQVLWALWALSRWKEADYSQGWMYFLYQFPLLNCIMMPVVISMVASRLADAEHKGGALRLLCTVQAPGRLFGCKFLCGSLYVLLASLLQTAAILAIGLTHSFGTVPWRQLGLFLLSGFVVGLTLLLFQQTLSLLFQNQLIPMLLGLAGGFVGLMAMFFPKGMQKLVPWAYYTVLGTIGMNWERETRITSFYWMNYEWGSLLFMLCCFLLFYLIGRMLFVRKER